MLIMFGLSLIFNLPILYYCLMGADDCGIPMMQWLRIYQISMIFLYIPGYFAAFFGPCMSRSLTTALSQLVWLPYFLHLTVHGIRGTIMLRSAENNCRASHPTAQWYMIFAIFICMLAAVALTMMIVNDLHVMGIENLLKYFKQRTAGPEWTAYRYKLIAYFEANAEDFDAEKHELESVKYAKK